MKDSFDDKLKASRRTLIVRIAYAVATIVAFLVIGLKGGEKDATLIFLEVIVTLLIIAATEIVLNALKVEEMEKALGKIRSSYQAIQEHLLHQDTIQPELKPPLELISKSYKAAMDDHLTLFGILAKVELESAKETISSLGNGRYKLRRQPARMVHSSWQPMIDLAERGDLIIATSDVTETWWEQNKEWEKSNRDLINRGIGTIRIFFVRSQDDYDAMKGTMGEQSKLGIQVNYAFVDDITRIGKKTRDFMLVKSRIADVNNPINAGKRIEGGVALGEQHLLNDRTDWESLTMTDDSVAIQEAADDITAYIRASRRFEDDRWVADFFDADLHQIMASKDLETTAEVSGLTSLIECASGRKYLDLGAGYGRMAVPLVMDNDVTVVAVEQSQDLLDEMDREFDRQVTNAALKGLSPKGQLIPKHLDIRNLLAEKDMAPASFDGAFSIFDSFGYYQSEKDDMKILEVTANLLKPGGILVLDLINPRQVHKRTGLREWGRGVSSFAYFDKDRNRFLESYVIKNSIFKFKPLISLRIYGLNEIVERLNHAGFDCSSGKYSRYGSLTLPLRAYDDHSSRLIIVARKKNKQSP